MSIIDFVSLNAKLYENEEAVVSVAIEKDTQLYKRRSYTWRELDKLSNKIANMLTSYGVLSGDKVALLSQNSLFWLPIYFGILKSGAVVVPLNYNNSPEELLYCVEFAECKGLFIFSEGKEYAFLENSIKAKLNFVFHIPEIPSLFEENLSEYSEKNCKVSLTEDMSAAIYYSSGTTGKPKAVLLTHKALSVAAEMELDHHKQVCDDRFLCVSPLYHTGSKIHWFGSLLVGGKIILFQPSSPKSLLQIIANEKITIAWLLVPQIQDLLSAIDFGDISIDQYDLSMLRLIHSGAQPVPKALIQQLMTTFPTVLYDTNYGLTESTGPGCINLGLDNSYKAGAIGKPDIRWQCKIVDEKDRILAIGEIGELAVKGPCVMQEYYKDPVSTAQVLKGGWLYTGDMAYMDQDGFIFLVDRKKDVIISSGENIYPVQIENHIRILACVKDVAVIGLDNPRMGEVVAAIVDVREGCLCSKSDIHIHCRDLPQYQRPFRVFFGSIYRNATGKIDKKKLRKLYNS